MNNRNDEAAFPVPIGNTDELQWGMSLRDWFAGQALHCIYDKSDFYVLVKNAYEIADAMIVERGKKP